MSMSIGTGDGHPALLTVPEVLHEVRISKAFFYKLVKSGKGPTITRLGDRALVSRENLASWLAKHEVVPEACAA